MMLVHPGVQLLSSLLSLYVLYLGYQRFLAAHLQKKRVFAWKRHVAVGRAVMIVWLAGFGLGLGMAWWAWKTFFLTGAHAWVGATMVPLIVFGYLSGHVMDVRKKKRRALPLVHMANNAILVALALWQLATGVIILKNLVLA